MCRRHRRHKLFCANGLLRGLFGACADGPNKKQLAQHLAIGTLTVPVVYVDPDPHKHYICSDGTTTRKGKEAWPLSALIDWAKNAWNMILLAHLRYAKRQTPLLLAHMVSVAWQDICNRAYFCIQWYTHLPKSAVLLQIQCALYFPSKNNVECQFCSALMCSVILFPDI
jgi:hypothetical protein